MITEKELLQAIKECERDPITYNSCEKLANFYIIYDHLFGEKTERYDSREPIKIIRTNGESKFLQMVDGVSAEEFLSVMDELVSQTIKVIHPRLYDIILQRFEQ